MSEMSVIVKERPLARLVGLAVRTDMTRAAADCSNLWEAVFCPRMSEITGKAAGDFQGASYGVSVMLNEREFDYWAAMEAREGHPVPEGMQVLDLPAGLYAQCPVSSLAQLCEVYTWLYGTWVQSQSDYVINMGLPCFECYDEAYCASGSFSVFVPVVRKEHGGC